MPLSSPTRPIPFPDSASPQSPRHNRERENLAASFLAVHQNFPLLPCGEIPLFGKKGSCLPYVLNHEVGRKQRIGTPCQHAGATSISQETSQPLPVHLQHLL